MADGWLHDESIQNGKWRKWIVLLYVATNQLISGDYVVARNVAANSATTIVRLLDS